MDRNNIICAIDGFNGNIEVASKTDDFNAAIDSLNASREYINHIEQFVKEMKQEEHDILQDVYNRFKEKGYVKSIKFT